MVEKLIQLGADCFIKDNAKVDIWGLRAYYLSPAIKTIIRNRNKIRADYLVAHPDMVSAEIAQVKKPNAVAKKRTNLANSDRKQNQYL